MLGDRRIIQYDIAVFETSHGGFSAGYFIAVAVYCVYQPHIAARLRRAATLRARIITVRIGRAYLESSIISLIDILLPDLLKFYC